MASPRRIFRIYEQLCTDAATIREFQVAAGEKVSGTINLLIEGDRKKLLGRFCDEMEELGGVLQGVHDDPYILEATQCFYWASLYAVTGGETWDDLQWDTLGQEAASNPTLEDAGKVLQISERLRELDPEKVPARKLFLLWWAMDNDYRHNTRFDQKWPIHQIMEADFQEMKKRSYLAPILRMIGES